MRPDPSPARPASILLVDDDLGTIHALGKALLGLGTIRFATNGVEALRLAHEDPPDLILMDGEMPGMNGFEVCQRLKAEPTLEHIPVVFVTSHAGQDFEESGFGHGAADFISKPIRPAIVAARARTQLKLKLVSDRLRTLSATDALTGLGNRRTLDEALVREWRRAQRSGEPLSLLMIDVDHFKRYNDLYGHPAGDACLAQVAQALQAQIRRPADLAARYGGEEFALLLPATDHHGATEVARRLLGAIAQFGLAHAASDCGPHVTVSIGVSSYDTTSALWSVGKEAVHDDASATVLPGDLLGAADEALYAAKRAGRARFVSGAIDQVAQRRAAQHPPI